MLLQQILKFFRASTLFDCRYNSVYHRQCTVIARFTLLEDSIYRLKHRQQMIHKNQNKCKFWMCDYSMYSDTYCDVIAIETKRVAAIVLDFIQRINDFSIVRANGFSSSMMTGPTRVN